MRVVPARFVALLFAFAIVLAAPILHGRAQPLPAAPAQIEPAETKPEASTAAPDASSEKPSHGGFAGALNRFLENDYDATETGIAEAAASGDPRAATVIEALRD